jgi:hypothetical protein
MPTEITTKLLRISEIMGDGYRFIKIRAACEQWEREAREGNKSSAALIDFVEKFDRLIVTVTKDKSKDIIEAMEWEGNPAEDRQPCPVPHDEPDQKLDIKCAVCGKPIDFRRREVYKTEDGASYVCRSHRHYSPR